MMEPDHTQIATLYADLMEEAKARIAAIDTAINKTTALLPPTFIQEFCFLQLRMLCELIALGCLVAHGDIAETSKLKAEWSADDIIKALKKIRHG